MDKMKKLIGLVQASSGLWLQIGRLIIELRAEGHKVADLADASGMSKRMAYNAVQVVEYIETAKLSKTAAVKVGFTKLLMLSNHVPPEEAKSWVLPAQAMSAKQLHNQLSGLGNNVMQFCLTDSDAKLFEDLLLMKGANKRGKGLANKEQALMKILTEYVMNLDQTPKVAKAA